MITGQMMKLENQAEARKLRDFHVSLELRISPLHNLRGWRSSARVWHDQDSEFGKIIWQQRERETGEVLKKLYGEIPIRIYFLSW